MTPLPKRRHSTRRGGIRKAAIHLSLAKAGLCPTCGKQVMPHNVCPGCGTYKGKQLLSIKQPRKKKQS